MINREVEWGGTHFEIFTCQQLINNVYVNVVPTSVNVELESYDSVPENVTSLSYVNTDDGVYLTKFFADKMLYMPNDAFYIVFYWNYNNTTMCERIPIKVVVDK